MTTSDLQIRQIFSSQWVVLLKDSLLHISINYHSKAYDMCWGSKVGAPNSPLPDVMSGIISYFKLGISPDKLVLGFPFYGYDFPCTSMSGQCETSGPFGGGSWQKTNRQIVLKLKNSTTGVQWDSKSSSRYFDYIDSDGLHPNRHQIWFDDSDSMAFKMLFSQQSSLRGVAFWTADYLPYHHDYSRFAAKMWCSVHYFTGLPPCKWDKDDGFVFDS